MNIKIMSLNQEMEGSWEELRIPWVWGGVLFSLEQGVPEIIMERLVMTTRNG